MTTATPTGIRGRCGPNDLGRVNGLIREAAQLLVNATGLYANNDRAIPADHPLRRALAALAEVDRETAQHANEIPWPPLFEPQQPITQWDDAT